MKASVRALLALSLPIAVAASGCAKFEARAQFKQGNAEYKNENYRAAISHYQKGLALDAEAKKVWRSLGLAAMATFRPGDSAKDNLEQGKLAVEAFENYLGAYPNDDKVQDYLLTIMIQAEKYDAALARLRDAARANPSDMKLQEAIASVLVKAKRLDEAAAYVEKLGNRATQPMVYTVGVACWDKAYRDPMLDATGRASVIETGVAMLKRSVALDPNGFESNVYLNLILREKAKLLATLDQAEEAQKLIEEAMIYQDKAKAIVAARKAAEAKKPAAGSS